jgi:hypothetical protein
MGISKSETDCNVDGDRGVYLADSSYWGIDGIYKTII